MQDTRPITRAQLGVFERCAKYLESARPATAQAALNIVERIKSLEPERPYQLRVASWAEQVFGGNGPERVCSRADRFVEEVFEFLQSLGYSFDRLEPIADYVHNRPVGEREQELGGVMVTLSALASAASLNQQLCGEQELMRVSTPEVIEKIRRKNASAAPGSPLPGTADVDLPLECGEADELQAPISTHVGRSEKLWTPNDGAVKPPVDGHVETICRDGSCAVRLARHVDWHNDNDNDPRDVIFYRRVSNPVPVIEYVDLVNDKHDRAEKIGIPGNFITHRNAWRAALVQLQGEAFDKGDTDSYSYWKHELKRFDESFDLLWKYIEQQEGPTLPRQAAPTIVADLRDMAGNIVTMQKLLGVLTDLNRKAIDEHGDVRLDIGGGHCAVVSLEAASHLAKRLNREAHIEQLLIAGQMASNCCYNMGQRAGDPISNQDAQSMRSSADRWDLERRALPIQAKG